MTYTLITANRNYSSWSLRPWLLMRALGIGFDDRIEPFASLDNHEAFRAFSPTGQVPVLRDGERTVWDSLGIALYLAERHTGVWPADEAARAWAVCAVAEMHGGFGALRRERTMTVGQRIRPTRGSAALARDVARIAELWDEGLSRFGGPWLAGERFTAVDAFYAPVAFRARAWGIDVGAAGARWVETLLEHPATREWETAALAETFREEGHEAEVAAYGEVTEDLRATA
ncbi:glutathione S-transferase family protein [Sphingomonas yunnanensis]|uniref:glutathione S-transferase family protein n=1 Tax=Sphingomonas yunnanensis TaxID=310400 RepID=UPI001CA6F439|nr:glutathione S-transferase family protein [Sphingomonas yunnanensis]MBY9061685.1 glutathione S-transferase family protein [Sphingomonas yunnanensis]